MGKFDNVIGGILAGSWANLFLFGFQLTEVYKYYTRYPKDSSFLKVIIGILTVLDLLEVISACAFAWLFAVAHWGEPEYLLQQRWPSPAFTALSGMGSMIVQSFLIHRYWQLTRRWYIAIFLLLLSMIAAGGEIGCGLVIILNPTYEDRGRVILPAGFWLGGAVAADIGIATALVFELLRVKSGFKSTKRTVRKLIHRSVSTGTATAILAVIISATFFGTPESNVPTGLALFFGRLYSLSMLFNLNVRHYDCEHVANHSNSITLPEFHVATVENSNRRSHRDNTTFSLGGIHVHHTVHTNSDGKSHPMAVDSDMLEK